MAANKGSASPAGSASPTSSTSRIANKADRGPHGAAESNGLPTSVPLEGKDLLDKARSLSNRPEDQIARACGYVGPSGRVLKKSFYRALVAAKGYTLPSSSMATNLSRGRHADFRTRVHGNGNLLIGQAYTSWLDL